MKLTYTQKYIAEHFLGITRPGNKIDQSFDDLTNYEFRGYDGPLKYPTQTDYRIAKKYAQNVLDEAKKFVENKAKELEASMKLDWIEYKKTHVYGEYGWEKAKKIKK